MQTYLTSRSRRLEHERCPRSRYLLHEAFGTGYELVRQSVPLATGSADHLIFALLLRGHSPQEAIGQVLTSYDELCASRGLNVKELEDQSRVYQEQRALIEALGRLAALRAIPALLTTYEVLEVEKLDEVTLWEDLDDSPEHYATARRGIWRSIPDALLRHRESGDLYILSWKTSAELPRDSDARTDMQGLSETWALEQRLDQAGMKQHARTPDEVRELVALPAKVRGVQMAYLLKGRKISAKDDAQEGATGKSWRHNSPLIWGYRDQSFPPKFAWSRDWRCSAPHPMRKSKWYPSGECSGDGRLHRRGDDWTSFAVWEAMGIHEWLQMLNAGEVTPEAGSALDSCWALPVPNFRPQDQVERWYRQTVAQERQVARDLEFIREYEANVQDPDFLWHRYQERLDELFPQHTEKWCNDTYGSRCPAWEICWGPDSTARDPLSSGLYQIRAPYEPKPQEEPD